MKSAEANTHTNAYQRCLNYLERLSASGSGKMSKRRFLYAIIISLILALTHLWFSDSRAGNWLNFAILDEFFMRRGALAAPANVAVVLISERSYKTAGLSTRNDIWPRRKVAELIFKLKGLGAAGVVLDLIFQDPSPDPTEDDLMAQALATIPSVVGIDVSKPAHGRKSREAVIYSPIKQIAESASAVGSVSMPMTNNIVRLFPREIGKIPPMSFQAASLFAPAGELPDKRDYINFYGPPETILTYDFDSVMTKSPSDLRSKIVFIGYGLDYTARGSPRDLFLSAFDSDTTFGVELHATATANILNQEWIRSLAAQYEVLYCFVFVFLLSLILITCSPIFSGLVLICCTTAWVFGAFQCFCQGLFLPGGTAIPLLLIEYSYAASYHYGLFRVKAQRLRDGFARYVPAQIVERIADNPQILKTGGQMMEVSAIFIDLKGFTSLSEKMKNGGLIALLSRYFSATNSIAHKNMGTILKSGGDSAFYIWGAPIALKNSRALALRSALEIRAQLLKLLAQEGNQFSGFRIGVHHGLAEVGNLGSEDRFDYTAVQDAINITSRVESLDKHLGMGLLLSEEVLKGSGYETEALLIGRFLLVGKSIPVAIYTIPLRPMPPLAKRLWKEAQRKFQQRDWQSAWTLFEKAANAAPELRTAAHSMFIAIHKFQKIPPKALWQGEIIMSSK